MEARSAGRRGGTCRRDAAGGTTGGSVVRALALATVGLLTAACAREEAPPGTLPDTRPPQIVETRPQDGAVVPGFDESLRIRFDEPVNVSRAYLRQVVASPAWRLRTDFGFSDVQLRPEGGWRDGVVYTFRFPPDLADILGNRREEGFVLRFSTGPPIASTRAFGRLLRRIDGTGIRDGRVLFLSAAGDSVPYSAVSDTGGVFELEALPPGRYTAWGFEDLNANLRLDRRLEPYDSAGFELSDATASRQFTLRVVEPDSTAPILVSAEAVDSVTVRLEFDDPLEPGQDTTRARISVVDTSTAEAWPVEAWTVGRPEVAADTGIADSLPGDTAVVDTAGLDPTTALDTAARDTAGGPPTGVDTTGDAGVDTTGLAGGGETGRSDRRTGEQRTGAAPSADSLPLPSREVTVRLGRPMQEGAGYRARAEGLVNLRKLAGGGDTVFVYQAAEDRLPPDSVPRDTAAVRDTAVVRDTGAVRDTAAGRDTTAAPDSAREKGGAARGTPHATGGGTTRTDRGIGGRARPVARRTRRRT